MQLSALILLSISGALWRIGIHDPTEMKKLMKVCNPSVFFDSVQNVAPGQARTADIRINNTVNKYGALTDWATGASWEAVPVGISSVAPVQAWYAELCLDFTVWRIGIHDPNEIKKLMNVCHPSIFLDSLQNCSRAGSNFRHPHKQYCP